MLELLLIFTNEFHLAHKCQNVNNYRHFIIFEQVSVNNILFKYKVHRDTTQDITFERDRNMSKQVNQKICVYYFSTKTYNVGTQKNCLDETVLLSNQKNRPNETVLLSTQNIC